MTGWQTFSPTSPVPAHMSMISRSRVSGGYKAAISAAMMSGPVYPTSSESCGTKLFTNINRPGALKAELNLFCTVLCYIVT